MGDVTVSVSLTKAQQGKLYMDHMRRGERIKEFRVGLRRIIALAEAAGNFEIKTAAEALLQQPAKDPA